MYLKNTYRGPLEPKSKNKCVTNKQTPSERVLEIRQVLDK